MKHLLFLTLLLPIIASAQNASYEDGLKKLEDNNGFQSIKFGNSARDFFINNEIQYTVESEDNLIGDSAYSSVENADLGKFNISDIRLNIIRIYSYRDSIYKIAIVINSEDKYKMLETLQATFSDGYQSNPYINKYVWNSDNMSLMFDFSRNIAYLMYEYIPIERRKNLAKEELNKARGSKL